jgi:predicted CoA-binding protein
MTPLEVLRRYRSWAVVGLSDRLDRPSHSVARFLMQHGYDITPVNPNLTSVLGLTCYPDVRSIPHPVDVVDIFRRSELVGPVVEDAIASGARVVWMQLGVINEEAAAKARAAGLAVIMDRCPAIEWRPARANEV